MSTGVNAASRHHGRHAVAAAFALVLGACSGGSVTAPSSTTLAADEATHIPEIALIEDVDGAGFELLCPDGDLITSRSDTYVDLSLDGLRESQGEHLQAATPVEAATAELEAKIERNPEHADRIQSIVDRLIEVGGTRSSGEFTVVAPIDPTNPNGPYLVSYSGVVVEGAYAIILGMGSCGIAGTPLDEQPRPEPESRD